MATRDRIDRYEIEGVVGHGAMGVVYKARDPVIGRELAIKTIRLSESVAEGLQDESGQRFARELRATGVLSHPNIVTVYDAGNLEDRASAYMAMEFVEGRSLRDRIQSGEPLSGDEILDITLQVARALDYAHARGIIHRDVKPGNILLRHDGLVKLADFGIARLGPSDLTATGSSIGSPSYIAPEALEGGQVDSRADLFSLGVVVYEALTAERPFTGDSLPALYHQILQGDPIPPTARRSGIPGGWDPVIMRLLAKKPEDRYATAADLINDLRRIERGYEPLGATRGPAGQAHDATLVEVSTAAGRPAGSFRGLIAVAIVILLVFIAAIFIGRTGEAGPAQPRSGADVAPPGADGETWTGQGALDEPEPRVEPEVAQEPAPPRPRGAPDRTPAPRTVAAVAATQAEPAPPALPEPVARAKLGIRLEASPSIERFEVLMDGEQVLLETFDPEISRRRRERTTLSRTIEIDPGHHWFEVRMVNRRGNSLTESAGRAVGQDEHPTMTIETKAPLHRKIRISWD